MSLISVQPIWDQTICVTSIFKMILKRLPSDVSIMAAWDTLFVSPLPSKTTITQQSFPCPTHQDPGKICTSAPLKVGGLEHIKEAEPGEKWNQYLQSWLPCWSDWVPQPREPSSSSGGSAHEPASWLQPCPWPQGSEQQQWQGPNPLATWLCTPPHLQQQSSKAQQPQMWCRCRRSWLPPPFSPTPNATVVPMP